jgi:hypothetical protein
LSPTNTADYKRGATQHGNLLQELGKVEGSKHGLLKAEFLIFAPSQQEKFT